MFFVRAAWASLWLFALPKEPFGLVCVWPATLIAAASYAFSPDPQDDRLVLFAVLWDLSMGFWLMVSAMKTPRDALLSTVIRLKDCSYHEIPLHRFLTPDRAAVLDRCSLMEYLGRQGLPYNHRNDVRVFRVEIGASATLPHALGAFNIPFDEAVILLRDDPDHAGVAERFYFWHEFGHTLGSEFALQSGLQKGIKNPLLALLLAACAMRMGWGSLLCLAMCLVGVWSLHRILERQKASFRAISEMKADEFAVELLTTEERRDLLAHPERLLPADRDLSAREHQDRVNNLRSVIQGGPSLADAGPGGSALAFVSDILLAATSLVGWMIVLSRYVAAPSDRTLTVFGWMIGIVAVGGVARWVLHYRKGILLEFIFMGICRWQNGQFRLLGSRTAQA